MMIITFDQNNPYSSQLLTEWQTQFVITRVNFHDIPDPVVVDHIPSSVKAIALKNSPNITFAALFPDVKIVDIKGDFTAFDDAMFHLQYCFLALDNPLVPGQITLRHTDRLVIYNAALHVDSLRDARAHSIVLRLHREFTIVPVIADGVNALIVHTDWDLNVDVHLTSIPDSLTHIQVLEKNLSTQALEMIHSHNQRLRYVGGPNAVQVHVSYANDVAPQDFTQENRKRDFYAHRIHVDLTQKFGDMAANEILQNVYGTHYKEAKFGTTLGGSQRQRQRQRQIIIPRIQRQRLGQGHLGL